MLTFLLTFVHVVVCFFLIGVILLQTGKRADLAGAFGGGGSQTAFGARGAATFLSRATTWCAIIFMCTSMLLALMHSRSARTGSVLDSSPVPAGAGAPAIPAPPPAGTPAPGQAPAGTPTQQQSQPDQAPAEQAPAEPSPAAPAPEAGQQDAGK